MIESLLAQPPNFNPVQVLLRALSAKRNEAPADKQSRTDHPIAWRKCLISDLPSALEQYHNVDAEEIRDQVAAAAGNVHELKFENCRVRGSLDLRNVILEIDVRFTNCIFDEGLDLGGSNLKSVSFLDCLSPTISISNTRLSGTLAINRSFVPFGLKIQGTQLNGALDLRGSVICSPLLFNPSNSFGKSHAPLSPSFRCCIAAAAIHSAQRQGGDVVSPLTDIQLIANTRRHRSDRREQEKLLVAFETQWQSAFGAPTNVSLDLEDKAINASNLRADQDVNCDLLHMEDEVYPFYAFGRFSIPGAQIRGVLRFTGARLTNAWRTGKSGRTVSLKLDGTMVDGSIEFTNGRDYSVPQTRDVIAFESYGAVRMFSVRILGALDCRGAKFHCCDARSTPSKGGERYSEQELATREMQKEMGALTLYNSSIAGIFDMRAPRENPHAAKKGPSERFGALKGYMSLRDSSAGRIMDDPRCWPRKGFLILEGFKYDGFTESVTAVREIDVPRRIFPLITFAIYSAVVAFVFFVFPAAGIAPIALLTLLTLVRSLSWIYQHIILGMLVRSPIISRSDWLELQPAWHLGGQSRAKSSHSDWSLPHVGFRPQPFEQLERVLRESGAEDDSRNIGILKHVYILHSTEHRISKEYKRILGMLAQFGYTPWRPAHIVLLLILASTIIFDAANRSQAMSIHDDEMRAAFVVCDAIEDVGTASQPPSLGPAVVVASKNVGIQIGRCPAAPDTGSPNRDEAGGARPPKGYPSFNAFVYSVETIVPFLELGQTDYWAPLSPDRPVCDVYLIPANLHAWLRTANSKSNGHLFDGLRWTLPFCFNSQMLQSLVWINETLGWLLASIFVAGLSGIMKR